MLIPEDFKFGGRLTIQQWHNDIEVYEPMFETDLKNFINNEKFPCWINPTRNRCKFLPKGLSRIQTSKLGRVN